MCKHIKILIVSLSKVGLEINFFIQAPAGN